MASTWARLSPGTGLSLLTKTATASREVRRGVGSYPNFASNLSTTVGFMARDNGPNWAVPSIRAGRAVLLPLPSIWMVTEG